MRNKVIATLATGLSIVGISVAPAFAWTYGLSGTGQCQPNGSYEITWTVNNSTENQDLTVTSSSNTAVVPVSTVVPAKQTKSFDQTADGTQPGVFRLKLNVNWPGDQADHKQNVKVTLDQACPQPTPPPVTPPTGGRGGGTPPPVTTISTPPVVNQIQTTPTAPVNAGEGGGTAHTSPLAVGGLVSSIAAVGAGLGLRRFKKQGF